MRFPLEHSSKESGLDDNLVSTTENQENEMAINNFMPKIGITFLKYYKFTFNITLKTTIV